MQHFWSKFSRLFSKKTSSLDAPNTPFTVRDLAIALNAKFIQEAYGKEFHKTLSSIGISTLPNYIEGKAAVTAYSFLLVFFKKYCFYKLSSEISTRLFSQILNEGHHFFATHALDNFSFESFSAYVTNTEKGLEACHYHPGEMANALYFLCSKESCTDPTANVLLCTHIMGWIDFADSVSPKFDSLKEILV